MKSTEGIVQCEPASLFCFASAASEIGISKVDEEARAAHRTVHILFYLLFDQ